MYFLFIGDWRFYCIVHAYVNVRCEEHTWRCSHFMDQEYPSIQILVAIAVGNRELKVDEKERREGRGGKRTAERARGCNGGGGSR